MHNRNQMKLSIPGFCVLLLVASAAFAQGPQVISAGGGSVVKQQLVIDFTIGEPVITTVSTVINCTQGFHQPLMATDLPGAVWSVKAWPNPVSNLLFLNIFSENTGKSQWHLYTITGAVLARGSITLPQGYSRHTISLTHLKQGLYILFMKEERTGHSTAFKLVKK